MSEAKQAPLPDLLDQVPDYIVLGIPGDEPMFPSYTNIPIGKLARQAAAELRRLHEENAELRKANDAFGQRQEWWNERMVALEAQRDALKQTLHDELAGNLRLRDLGGARPDEPMLTFLERIIAERDALLKALKRMATIIDKMGDMPDGFIHPSPWQELKCEEALTQALAAIKAVEEGQ